LAMMVPQIQESKPGARPTTKQLLARVTVCLVVTVFLLAVYLSTSSPVSQNPIPASNARKLLSSNTSEQSAWMHNASNKQGGSFGGGPGGPVSGLCTTDHVSSILLCNHGSTPIRPRWWQTCSWWEVQGSWIAPSQCYHFNDPIIKRKGYEWAPLFMMYQRQGQAWRNNPVGGWFTYKDNYCVGEYRCVGAPVVCTKGSASGFVPVVIPVR